MFAIVNFAGFAYFCNADMYEDTLVARLMWEQKTLFPENYIFGNQYYVIATPVFAALFYGLTGSMNTAMALATTLMSLLIVLSLGWMIKPYIKSRSARLAVLLTLAAAVYVPHILETDEGQLFFVMASYYACYLITFFFLAGDYVRARTDSSTAPGGAGCLAGALFLHGDAEPAADLREHPADTGRRGRVCDAQPYRA